MNLVRDSEPLAWLDSALCAETDPEAFFPEKGQSPVLAKRVCMACRVRPECLEWALDGRITYGIYGGKSIRERRAILRRREQKEVAA